jgi:transcriptional regulator with AAA-type ATPase domain
MYSLLSSYNLKGALPPVLFKGDANMATKKAIQKIKTKRTQKRVYKRTPKLKKPSKAKAVSDFYGQPIAKGKLHKRLRVAQDKKLSVALLRSALAKLKRKKHKTAQDVKKEREIIFALNAKTKWGKGK